METVSLNKEDLLKAHKEGCSATKKALENLYPGVFKNPKPQRGQIFIWKSDDEPMICVVVNAVYSLQGLRNPKSFDTSSYPWKDNARPMISGTIILTIIDGKIAGAEVKED